MELGRQTIGDFTKTGAVERELGISLGETDKISIRTDRFGIANRTRCELNYQE